MNANQMNTGRGYWLAWFLASMMGYGMGAILGVAAAYRLFDRDPFEVLMGVTLGTVMGAIGGYFQWVVLRERFAGTGLWWLASALGLGLGMGLITAADVGKHMAVAVVLLTPVFGLVAGILQWLILRRKLLRSGWWLLASLLGTLVGAVAFPMAVAISETGNWSAAVLTFGLGFGAGNGAITGAALIWLLGQSPSGDAESLATAH